MIHKIYTNTTQFKPIEFSSGLNVILAEQTEKATDKDSRNGVGKSTFIEVIHFCLGADSKSCGLPISSMNDWAFNMDMTLHHTPVIATRYISKDKYIFIQGDAAKLPIPPQKDKEGTLFYKLEDWRKLLGMCLLGLEQIYLEKNKPSFRGLIGFFVRRTPKAFINAFSHGNDFSKKSIGQISNAFLLGLNWKHANEAQEIRDKRKFVGALESAAKAGVTVSKGELEAESVRLQSDILLETEAIKNFKVHPHYQEIQEKANQLTKIMHTYSNELFVLNRKLSNYLDSVENENFPSEHIDIIDIYKEAKVLFADSIKKTLEEAQAFHAAVIENRKKFLQTEILELRHQIAKISEELKTADQNRAQLMNELQDFGALEEFSQLQEGLIEKKGRLENIKNKLQNLKDFVLQKNELKQQGLILESKIQRDYEESRANWTKAVTLFNEASQALYSEPGSLIIDTNENGYTFDINIERSKSDGINKMKIFCYDIMLVDKFSEQGFIDFLIHDSIIFDGVDPRQRAHALMYAHKKALENNFQYICTINSDMLPTDELDVDFNIFDYVRLKLGDVNPEESLLGFRF